VASDCVKHDNSAEASIGTLIRRARVVDAPAIAAIHIASSDDAYAPLAAVWPSADAAKRAAMWTETLSAEDPRCPVFIAEDETGAVIGFCGAGPARRSEPLAEVEIHVIHVLPAYRGRGIGDALWKAICLETRGPNLASMYVDTLAELACCSFYESRGGEVIERRFADFHGATRTHVTFRWLRGKPNNRPGRLAP
jgi:ribosomal protein S18 acetylase RimI-like enzyme